MHLSPTPIEQLIRIAVILSTYSPQEAMVTGLSFDILINFKYISSSKLCEFSAIRVR